MRCHVAVKKSEKISHHIFYACASLDWPEAEVF